MAVLGARVKGDEKEKVEKLRFGEGLGEGPVAGLLGITVVSAIRFEVDETRTGVSGAAVVAVAWGGLVGGFAVVGFAGVTAAPTTQSANAPAKPTTLIAVAIGEVEGAVAVRGIA